MCLKFPEIQFNATNMNTTESSIRQSVICNVEWHSKWENKLFPIVYVKMKIITMFKMYWWLWGDEDVWRMYGFIKFWAECNDKH